MHIQTDRQSDMVFFQRMRLLASPFGLAKTFLGNSTVFVAISVLTTRTGKYSIRNSMIE